MIAQVKEYIFQDTLDKNEERYQTEYHFNGSTYEKKYNLNEDEIEEFQDLPKSCLKKIKKEKKFKLVDRNSPFTTFEYTNQSQPGVNSTHAITNETSSETETENDFEVSPEPVG